MRHFLPQSCQNSSSPQGCWAKWCQLREPGCGKGIGSENYMQCIDPAFHGNRKQRNAISMDCINYSIQILAIPFYIHNIT